MPSQKELKGKGQDKQLTIFGIDSDPYNGNLL